jgi:hypothetical protein
MAGRRNRRGAVRDEYAKVYNCRAFGEFSTPGMPAAGDSAGMFPGATHEQPLSIAFSLGVFAP